VTTLTYRLTSYWLHLLADGITYPFYRRRYGSVQLDDPGKGLAKRT